MFERNDAEIAELRFSILNSMMDDAEDVEQIYLSVNGNELLKGSIQPGLRLRDIIDEMRQMLEEGYIAARYTNDAKRAPLDNLNLSLFHHYWFEPTKRGKEIWEAGSPPTTPS